MMIGEHILKRKCSSYGPENVTSVGDTGVEQDVFSFLWNVNNYSILVDTPMIKSPIFRGGPKHNHGWQLVVYPKRKVDEVEYLSVFLRINDYGDENESTERVVKANVQLHLLNGDGRPARTFRSIATNNAPLEFKKSGNMWGTNKLIASADLVNPIVRLVVEDSLKIHCEITIIGGLKQKVVTGGAAKASPSAQEREKLSRDRLAKDLGKMFEDSVGTNVSVVAGKSTFKAHTNILSARSSVFSAMFNANMKEKEMKTVRINDFDEEVVKAMLDYVYTGKTDAMQERGPELLEIAEKYLIAGLKEECEYVVADNLKMQNAAAILVLAHTHNAPYLKQRTIDFINMNKEEMLKSKSFQDAVRAHAGTGGFVDLLLSP